MNWLRRLAAYRILDVGAIAITIAVIIFWVMVLPARWSKFDFNHYYVGGRMLFEGQNPYTASLPAMSRALGFQYSEDYPIASYPPSFLWMFAALAALPPRGAFAIWLVVEISCLVGILWLTRRLLGERVSARGWLFVVALTIISRTVSYSLFFSQVQLLLAVLVLAAYMAHRDGRHGWACFAVSVAGIIKFYPFVLLPWFVWSGGGVRARLYRLIGAFGFVALVIAVTGPGLWRDYLRYGIPTVIGEENGRNFHFSLPAMVTNLGYLYHDFRLSPSLAHWWWSVGTLAGLAIIAIAYGLCLVVARDPEAQFCLLCVAMLVGTVTVQGHYFVFMVFPLAVAAIRVATKPTLGKVICLIAVVVAVNLVDPPESPFLWRHLFWYILISNLPLYGLFGLGAFFCRELREQRGLPDGQAVP